jgi:hypothetical protein
VDGVGGEEAFFCVFFGGEGFFFPGEEVGAEGGGEEVGGRLDSSSPMRVIETRSRPSSFDSCRSISDISISSCACRCGGDVSFIRLQMYTSADAMQTSVAPADAGATSALYVCRCYADVSSIASSVLSSKRHAADRRP